MRFITSLQGHKNWVRSAEFHPDGRLVASGGDDRTVRIWDIRTKRCVRIYEDHSSSIHKVGFHPDSTRVASAGT
jgi:centriolar protein POC1